MPDPTGVLYADTSALVKLAVDEPETQAPRIELNRWDTVATSVITEIELAPRLPGLESVVRRRLTTSRCGPSPPHCSNSS